MPRPTTSLARGGKSSRRLVELCRARLDSVTFRRQLRAELARVVAFDLYCVNTVDPHSLLLTSSVGDGLSADGARRLFELEESGADLNQLAVLARRPPRVVTLAEATRGDVQKSARMRELFWPMGQRDELRAALVLGGQCWGYLHLFRSVPFRPDEVRRVEQLAPLLASALRASLLVGLAPAPPRPPALLLLSSGATIVSLDDRARPWLRDLAGDVGGACPHPLISCVTRARRAASADGVYRTPGGAWLRFHGRELGGNVALSLATPAARELAPLWCSAHGLSSREREVCALLLDGHGNDSIAARLGIRAFTVKDHVKSILRKTRAPSRVALLAELCV